MSSKEIIDILENEQLTLKYKNIQNIPMGESIHFTFTAPKEEISKKWLKGLEEILIVTKEMKLYFLLLMVLAWKN